MPASKEGQRGFAGNRRVPHRSSRDCRLTNPRPRGGRGRKWLLEFCRAAEDESPNSSSGGGYQNRPAPNALACDRPPPSVPRASPASAGCRGRGTATPASQYGSSQFGAGSAPGSAGGSARGSVRRLLRSFPRVGGVDWKMGGFLDRGVDRQSYWVRSLPGTETSKLGRNDRIGRRMNAVRGATTLRLGVEVRKG